jgi:MarR family
MAGWTFLTPHARVLLCVAHDPGVRLREIAASLNISERSAFGIITDLAQAGYVVKEKDGRRNRYHVQTHLPRSEPDGRKRTIDEILDLLTGTDTGRGQDGGRLTGSRDRPAPSGEKGRNMHHSDPAGARQGIR